MRKGRKAWGSSPARLYRAPKDVRPSFGTSQRDAFRFSSLEKAAPVAHATGRPDFSNAL